MFDYAKQFAAADEVLIAAPFWNFSIPAKLHDYLELVCTQGVTFDVDETGAYVSLCRARKLTFVTTSGGIIAPEDDHAFGYVQTLAKVFWHIPEVLCVMAEGLDAAGANVEALLAAALKHEGNVKSCMQD
jgi:FMN-dependent NADH-azoreductase